MCDPVSIAISTGLALVQRSAQNQQIQAQMDAIGDQTNQAYARASEQERLVNQEASLEKTQRISKGLEERAKIATIAGESGALGFSSDRLIGESFMQQSFDTGLLEDKRQHSVDAIELEKQKVHTSGQAGIKQAKSQSPSWAATGLQIAGDSYKIDRMGNAKASSQIPTK